MYQQVYDPVSPILGWLGSAIGGSDTSSNTLFRRVVGCGLLLLAMMVVLVGLPSTPVLSWMVA